jgi:hypothetical protein
VVVIPLLFETGAESDCDKVICVGCSAVAQREPAGGAGPRTSPQRLAAQWPIEQKIALDFVVGPTARWTCTRSGSNGFWLPCSGILPAVEPLQPL